MVLLVMRRYALLLRHSPVGMQLHTLPSGGAIAVARVAGRYVVHHWLLSTHHLQRPQHHASIGSLQLIVQYGYWLSSSKGSAA